MNKKLLFSLLLAGTAFTGHADEARLLRFPATNGSDIVFSYAGDLYKAPLNGGEAQKLTSHIGYEMFARFSPDGKSIAFTGQYDGNTEVYLIPTDGGEPQRLTYTATNSRDDLGDRMGPNNIVMTWTPDGKNIVYRNRISDGFDGKLWSISKNGGMSEVIPLPEGGFCSYSPDGKKLAYNRVMREFRNWKYYRGGMADDIWIYDPAAKKVENRPVKIKPIPICRDGARPVSTSCTLFTALQYFPCHATRYILRLPEGGVSFIEAILDLGDCRIADLLLAEAGR